METQFLKMSDGQNIALHSWLPNCSKEKIKKIIIISHGMAESATRYSDFAEYLNKKGYAVFAHDHRGHGETAGTVENLGFLAEENGFKRVVADLVGIVDYVTDSFPARKIILLGHSFGSFIAQSYIEYFGNDINACILSGTAGPRFGLGSLLKGIASVMCLIFGKKSKGRFLTLLTIGPYNNKIPKKEKTPTSWLSRDAQYLNKSYNGPYYGFICTNAFFKDLGTGLSIIHKKKNLKKIPKKLPILFITGTQDPVGSYTKTVKKLANIYRKIGIKNITEIYYDGARHEPINEINRAEVYEDIFNWIEQRT
ncbi:MAG: alpha/beta hydrolase [Treponema sp.]|nr:alpha/beta hydrolase [Treponema sp.]